MTVAEVVTELDTLAMRAKRKVEQYEYEAVRYELTANDCAEWQRWQGELRALRKLRKIIMLGGN